MPEYPVTVQMHRALEAKVAELSATVAQLAGVVNEMHTKMCAAPLPKKEVEAVKDVPGRKWYEI